MRGAGGNGPAVDLAALSAGVVWGLLLLVVSALLLGVLDFRFPPSPEAEAGRTLVVQGVAAALAGLRAARAAGRGGFLHGLLAGVAVMAAAIVLVGIFRDLPRLVGIVRGLLIGAGAGAVAGVATVNLRRG
ncbi:MAG: TIGR04086 family membrane protein [Symbiobacterium sp.]|uniref:TIGR04086 family membrane protein n=1 Tax=Symbiobacterium sp. TaxID=1971213 RepID=UPI0034639E71